MREGASTGSRRKLNTILKAIPNKAEAYAALLLADVQNVKEWGMGIRITGSRNILIQDTAVNNCWGDG